MPLDFSRYKTWNDLVNQVTGGDPYYSGGNIDAIDIPGLGSGQVTFARSDEDYHGPVNVSNINVADPDHPGNSYMITQGDDKNPFRLKRYEQDTFWDGVRGIVNDFVLPAVGMYFGVGALGSAAGGAAGAAGAGSEAAGGFSSLPAEGMTATGTTAPWAGTTGELGTLGSGTYGATTEGVGSLMGTTGGIGELGSGLSGLTAADLAGSGSALSGGGALSSIMDAVKNNPSLLTSGANIIGSLLKNKNPAPTGSGSGALSGIGPAGGSWSPTQQQWANQYFNTLPDHTINPYQGDLARAPITGGEHMWFGNQNQPAKMAHGGQVKGALSQISDGQSDDVPIMGSRGEFMVPADVVSALGSGSSDAGAEALHGMMHAVRQHHRSTDPNDIPPRAKSPLEYMRDGMKGK